MQASAMEMMVAIIAMPTELRRASRKSGELKMPV